MRLYVVNETSPDPAHWGEWHWRSLVLAESADKAREIAGDWANERTLVVEINTGLAGVLMEYHPPAGL